MAVFGKAQYIKRVEDDRLLTGTGGFTDNLARPNQAHVVLVRSPHAHARIVKIDTAAARKAPGAVAVFTWDDMAKEGCGYFALPAMFPNADGSKPDMTRVVRWRMRSCDTSARRSWRWSPRAAARRRMRPSWSRSSTIPCRR